MHAPLTNRSGKENTERTIFRGIKKGVKNIFEQEPCHLGERFREHNPGDLDDLGRSRPSQANFRSPRHAWAILYGDFQVYL